MSAKYKDRATKLSEVCEMMKKLKHLGITREAYPEIATFVKDASRFVNEQGSISNKIPLHGTERKLIYNFVTSEGIDSNIILKHSHGT